MIRFKAMRPLKEADVLKRYYKGATIQGIVGQAKRANGFATMEAANDWVTDIIRRELRL